MLHTQEVPNFLQQRVGFSCKAISRFWQIEVPQIPLNDSPPALPLRGRRWGIFQYSLTPLP